MDRTWSHQGVPPVDCQYLTLSTGALIPREGETGHFEGYRPASKHMGMCGGDQKEKQDVAISCFHKIRLLYLSRRV